MEKGRILAALESETRGDDAVEVGARLQLEEIIATTDRLVADKDREVAELQSLLASQSGNLGAVAVGAAAVGDLLDQDTVVQQQRETLRRLQEQWMEKLRQAEIDIPRERCNWPGKGPNSKRKPASWRRIVPRRKAKRAAARPQARRVAAAGGAAWVEGRPVSVALASPLCSGNGGRASGGATLAKPVPPGRSPTSVRGIQPRSGVIE